MVPQRRRQRCDSTVQGPDDEIGTRSSKLRGISLLELLVALAVIAVVTAVSVPAISSAREAARKNNCTAHLRQLGLGISAFETQQRCFPSGLRHKYELLPFLGESALYHSVDPSILDANELWSALAPHVITVYLCPSDSPDVINGSGCTNYAGCFGSGSLHGVQNGVFVAELDMPHGIRPSEISDGLSTTVAMAEILHGRIENGRGTGDRLRTVWETPVNFAPTDSLDAFANYCDSIPPNAPAYGWVGSPFRGIPWLHDDRRSGLYNHALTPNRPSCTNGTHVPTGIYTSTSAHPGGVNVLFADGHVTFVSHALDREVWRGMGARNDAISLSVD